MNTSPCIRIVVITMLILSVILVMGCQSGPKSPPTGKERRESIKTVTKWMTGTFRNRAQARQSPGEYHDIRLVQVPIWTAREDGPWLYVEQSHEDDLDRPYRQRIYRLVIQDDGRIESQVFGMPGNPLDYTSPWRGNGSLGGLNPKSLVPRPGCHVVFERVDGNTYTGGIDGTGCPSTLDGASYLTSDVTLRADRILIWDRGYSADGEQVWGSTAGPYIFKRQSRGAPE
ncbi:MAG: chromophore lyase CpcT/CpeT [Phycisphaerales bacterium]|nr:chromophore lyase CpcT/CpeT [Phycisphaerales bacterium]